MNNNCITNYDYTVSYNMPHGSRCGVCTCGASDVLILIILLLILILLLLGTLFQWKLFVCNAKKSVSSYLRVTEEGKRRRRKGAKRDTRHDNDHITNSGMIV
jgi:hypothetical protein